MEKRRAFTRIQQFAWVILLVGCVSISLTKHANAQPIGRHKLDAFDVIRLVNQLRVSNGLPAYQVNNALMNAAQGHSDYQAKIGSITHTGAGGSRPVDRAAVAGYGGGMKIFVSENIYGGNNASASQAVGWWQGDTPHLNTMVSANYTDAGAGVAIGGSVVYYTLDAGYVSGSPGAESTTGENQPTPMVVVPFLVATPAADGSITHVVQPGQALWNIAAAYNVPLDDLLDLNQLSNNSFIYPGDKILVRASKTPTVIAVITQTATYETMYITPSVAKIQSDMYLKTSVFTITQPVLSSPTLVSTTEQDQKATNSDLILWGITGFVVIGTSLILVSSLFHRKGRVD